MKKMVIAALAVVTAAAPTAAAFAQAATAVTTTLSGPRTDGSEVSARTFFGYREYIRGIQRTEAQYQQLKDFGCTLSPDSFAIRIVTKAIAEGYMCSRRFFSEVGRENSAGTMYDITYLGASGATVVKTIKGNKVGQNYVEISTYSLAADSSGRPLTVTYNYHANGGQYAAQMWTGIPSTVLGATLPGIVAAATRPDCDGPCGQPGFVNIVTANSGSQSSATNTNQVQNAITQAAQAGGCGTGTCGANPAHRGQ